MIMRKFTQILHAHVGTVKYSDRLLYVEKIKIIINERRPNNIIIVSTCGIIYCTYTYNIVFYSIRNNNNI